MVHSLLHYLLASQVCDLESQVAPPYVQCIYIRPLCLTICPLCVCYSPVCREKTQLQDEFRQKQELVQQRKGEIERLQAEVSMVTRQKEELERQKNESQKQLDELDSEVCMCGVGRVRMFVFLPLVQSTVWWKVLMAFLHNRAAESHEILSECSRH